MRRWLSLIVVILLGVPSLEAVAQPIPRPERKGRKYKVRIDSAPQQAAIYLDDEKYGIVGYTPWDGRLQKGDWKVIIKADGYEPVERVVRVKRTSRVQEVFVPLVKKEVPAVLDLGAAADKNAFGAEVWVDGQLQGTIPVIINATQGRHLVEIKKEGFEDFSQWVEAKEGERIRINPVLKPLKKEPQKGSILVDADVPDAEVSVDGVAWTDTTPTLIPNVPEGPHIVEVRKAPSMPWKVTVVVEAGKTSKVSAKLKAGAGGEVGAVRVISNVEGAEVVVDGTPRGKAPVDIKDLSPGEHVIEVRAKGYRTRSERVTVSAGSATVLDMNLSEEADVAGTGLIKVVSPVPEAAVFVDGEAIGAVPVDKRVPAGEHFVVVTKTGYKTFESKISVEAGQTVTVTAELKSVGTVQVLSTPGRASVMVDGEAVGTTPLTLDAIEAGAHVITVRKDDYYDHEESITVKGGERVIVNAQMKRIDLGPTEEELLREQRARSSFGARTLGKEKPTADFSVGYPHLIEARFTIGAGNLKNFGLDAGIGVKTFFSRTDMSVNLRLQLLDVSPLSVAVFASPTYGTRFDRSHRDSFALDAGGIVSLTAVGRLTITGRVYLNMFSDRFCPGLEGTGFERNTSPSDLCVDYLAGTLDPEKKQRVDELLGGADKIYDRHTDLRLMIGLIVEYALDKKWNIWGILEGTPALDERPAYTDAFNGILLENDNGVYVRIGGTFKF